MARTPPLTDFAVILHERDNVATALVDVPPGDYAPTLTVPEEIPAGFKLAVAPIGSGQKIYKYGYVIGVAREDIQPGRCVHVHNMASLV